MDHHVNNNSENRNATLETSATCSTEPRLEGTLGDQLSECGPSWRSEEVGARPGSGGMRPSKFPAKNEREILLRKVRSVLNRISSVNYYRLRKRWLSLVPSNVDQLAEVVQLMIGKALEDVQYMNIYARLLGYLVNHRPSHVTSNVRSLLYALINDELMKINVDRGFNNVEKEWIGRRRKVTLYRFITELFVENACHLKFFMEQIGDILATYHRPGFIDEALECICVVLTFAGQKLDSNRKEWLDELFNMLNLNNVDKLTVSKRVQFMVLDLLEMRARGWEPHNKWWAPSVQVRNDASPSHRQDCASPGRLTWRQPDNTLYLGRNELAFDSACGSCQRSSEASCTIIGIMNKVSSSTLVSMAEHLANILPTENELLDNAVNTFLGKAISEPAFAQIYAHLIARAAEQVLTLDGKIRVAILNYVEGNLACLGGIRMLSELYNVDVTSSDDLKHIMELLCLSSGDACLESLCNLLFIAGKKLDFEVYEANRDTGRCLDAVFEKMLDRICSTTGARLKCFIYDLMALRCNGWIVNRPLNYIMPPVIDSTRIACNITNVIKIVAKYGQTNLNMARATLCSPGISEKYVFEGLCWAIENQSEDDIAMFIYTLKLITKDKSMADVRPRMDIVLGQFVQHLACMKYRSENAWLIFGRIMEELHC